MSAQSEMAALTRPMWAIGLMSGTSQDGIDVAAIQTDGEQIVRFGPAACRSYSEAERALLRRATTAAASLNDRAARPGVVAEAEALITEKHAEAVENFLQANPIVPAEVAVVGFHGQTLLHRPERHLTIQIGLGPVLASRLGLPVVYDFRAADVAAGGQGAPLVPVFHRALASRLDCKRPVAVLNIGGVANVTYVDGETLIACDTGPGNALLDDFVSLRTGRAFDGDGRLGQAGVVQEDLLQAWLSHPFFSRPPPKSLDRDEFRVWVTSDLEHLGVEAGAATLTALTAASVAAVLPHLPSAPATWIVSGGGARNPTLVRMLAEQLRPARVATADQAGWVGDAVEAQAFGYLAVRTLRGLPITFPGTTGVAQPLCGGVLAKP